jgi:ABC-type transport system involved in multi-copper enzyme maturation permease subunit
MAVNVVLALLGPLVVPECRRAVGRGWLILVRCLAALGLVGIGLVVVWLWWFGAQTDPNFQPHGLLRTGMLILEGMAIVIGLILAPAVMAGSLAGEKERGVLPLLLTTSVTPREIVLGRLIGKMSQVVMILLAGLPALVLLGGLDGLGLPQMTTLIALPLAVTLGTGGLSSGFSALSHRGRDALLSVYLILVLVLLIQLALPFVPAGLGLERISPMSTEVLVPLIWDDQVGPAWTTIAVWLGVGLAGVVVAAWRLRASCLGRMGAPSRRDKKGRGVWVPPVGDRPMLWKELFIERTGTLGRFGAWIGLLLVGFLGLGSVGLAGGVAWFRWVAPDSSWETYLLSLMGWLYAGFSMTVIGFLLEGAVGLRASVAISSERERNTWDGLLTSPLTGAEIVNGKLVGSLFALRWLFLATLLAWGLSLGLGVITTREFLSNLVPVVVVGAFLAAVGVRISVSTGTATRAMSLTMGVWMGAGLALFVASWILTLMLCLFWIFCWWMAVRLQLASSAAGIWAPISVGDLQVILSAALYLATTSLIASESRLRFDRAAGRMAGGEVQVAFDQMLHGRPLAPVRLESGGTRPRAGGPGPSTPSAVADGDPGIIIEVGSRES